jgi:hypothetical protein
MAPRNEETIREARQTLGFYNQGSNPEHFSCPACGLGFDTLDQQDAFAYNRHAAECVRLLDETEAMMVRS